MQLSEFEYQLPAEAVAQEPIEPRDAARLLVDRGAEVPPEHSRVNRLAAEVESKGIGAGPGTPEGVDAGALDPDGVPQAVIEAASRTGTP